MAKKQTRRSISFSRPLFEQSKAHAAALGIPHSQLAEAALRAEMQRSADETRATAPTEPAVSP